MSSPEESSAPSTPMAGDSSSGSPSDVAPVGPAPESSDSSSSNPQAAVVAAGEVSDPDADDEDEQEEPEEREEPSAPKEEEEDISPTHSMAASSDPGYKGGSERSASSASAEKRFEKRDSIASSGGPLSPPPGESAEPDAPGPSGSGHLDVPRPRKRASNEDPENLEGHPSSSRPRSGTMDRAEAQSLRAVAATARANVVMDQFGDLAFDDANNLLDDDAGPSDEPEYHQPPEDPFGAQPEGGDQEVPQWAPMANPYEPVDINPTPPPPPEHEQSPDDFDGADPLEEADEEEEEEQHAEHYSDDS